MAIDGRANRPAWLAGPDCIAPSLKIKKKPLEMYMQ